MSSTRWVALLRGINVGRARQVGMPRLAEVLTTGKWGGVVELIGGDTPIPEAVGSLP